MRSEKIQDRAEDCGITQSEAQILGGQPGQIQQTAGAIFTFQQPAERTKRQRLRIDGG